MHGQPVCHLSPQPHHCLPKAPPPATQPPAPVSLSTKSTRTETHVSWMASMAAAASCSAPCRSPPPPPAAPAGPPAPAPAPGPPGPGVPCPPCAPSCRTTSSTSERTVRRSLDRTCNTCREAPRSQCCGHVIAYRDGRKAQKDLHDRCGWQGQEDLHQQANRVQVLGQQLGQGCGGQTRVQHYPHVQLPEVHQRMARGEGPCVRRCLKRTCERCDGGRGHATKPAPESTAAILHHAAVPRALYFARSCPIFPAFLKLPYALCC